MNKKFLSLLLSLVLALSLTACGGNDTVDTAETEDGGDTAAETVTLKVAASSTPHAEILEQVKPILAEQGIDLQVTEYSDYPIQNTVVDEGEEDANYFQHTPYLEQFNAENGTDLVSAGKIHYEPMGVYAGKTDSLENLADGATIAVPNDATNEARALQLLAAQGLIELAPDAGLTATKQDITANPKNLEIVEMEAAQLPRSLASADMAVINGNYATQAGFSSANDALAAESADSDAAQLYPNVLVVEEGRENDPAILAVAAALQSDAVRDFINETYGGAVVPLF